MSRKVNHFVAFNSHEGTVVPQKFKYTATGRFFVGFPGRLKCTAVGGYTFLRGNRNGPKPNREAQPQIQERPLQKVRIPPPDEPILVKVPVTAEIKWFAPDGREWTKPDITLAEIQGFRDPLGGGMGQEWTYQATTDWIKPTQEEYFVNPLKVHIAMEETVELDSAPDLVSARLTSNSTTSFEFDLFHIGKFSARVVTQPFGPKHGGMIVTNPDGIVIARTPAGKDLLFEVTLPHLRHSRSADGSVRKWRLQVAWPNAIAGFVVARVDARQSLPVDVVQSRLNALFGAQGEKLTVFAQRESDGANLLRLKFNDVYTAETFGMHGILRKIAPPELNSAEEIRNPKAGVVYTLAHVQAKALGLRSVDLSKLKLLSFSVSIGASVLIQPSVPALRVQVNTSGKITGEVRELRVNWDVSARPRGNQLRLELGLVKSAAGELSVATAVQTPLFDIDGSNPLTAFLIEIWKEDSKNESIAAKIREFLGAIGDSVPQLGRALLGGEFEFTRVTLENNALAFDYRAPKEPDPRPSKGYIGVAGRDVVRSPVAGQWQVMPRVIPGASWEAGNLAKIDHIVVVMMENRSYDHVLGYRALAPTADGSDGWTPQLIDFFNGIANDQGGPHKVRQLAESGILANPQTRLKTQLRSSVGHSLQAVRQQLAGSLAWQQRTVLDPKGFKENFAPLALGGSVDGQVLVPDDVLGYYTANDLPFYGFLAQHYGFSDRYFSSHAGPTLPNRMFWLTGDFQFDRLGVPIIDNNHGDNWRLSRARTIFDVLSTHSVSWRVYESAPSVAMARFFARYAGNNTNIVPITRFDAEARAGTLPAVSFVEPAMHHSPANDDHPPVDMYDGQRFLHKIYSALTARPERWRKTLLIISYDEHGGFYDHALPPVAEIRTSGTGLPIHWQQVFTRAAATELVVRYGVRVPAFVVSPWVPAGKGPAAALDHTSILKTILARFTPAAKPFLSDRVAAATSFNAFLSNQQPRAVPPPPMLVPPPRAARPSSTAKLSTAPVTLDQLQRGELDFHELGGLLGRMLGRAAGPSA